MAHARTPNRRHTPSRGTPPPPPRRRVVGPYHGPVPSRLDGKVILLSGGGADIGRATALRLAAEGAAVAVGDVGPDRAATVAETITASGGRAIGSEGAVRHDGAGAGVGGGRG